MLLIKGSWDDQLMLMEVAYNNIYHDRFRMEQFKALYGSRSRSHISWFDIREVELIGPYLVCQDMEKV